MCIGRNWTDDIFILNVKKFENSKGETVLGVTIDSKLIFDNHIKKSAKKLVKALCTFKFLLIARKGNCYFKAWLSHNLVTAF